MLACDNLRAKEIFMSNVSQPISLIYFFNNMKLELYTITDRIVRVQERAFPVEHFSNQFQPNTKLSITTTKLTFSKIFQTQNFYFTANPYINRLAIYYPTILLNEKQVVSSSQGYPCILLSFVVVDLHSPYRRDR